MITAGTYNISTPGLFINTSGVVIRGQGSGSHGTTIQFTSTEKSTDLFNFGSTNGTTTPESPGVKIIDDFVPVGAKVLTIDSTAGFTVGDRIIVELIPNQIWVNHLSAMEKWGW